jgi:AraC-like DNA-binding protein
MMRLETKRGPAASGQSSAGGPSPGALAADAGEGDRKIAQIVDYMTQHLNEPIQVARLASLVNVSTSHFFALFKRQTGCAPIDFFIRLRMHQACQLLDTTSLNVKEVAARLGYDDPFYFSRTFKAINHVPPSEYKSLPEDRKGTLRDAAMPPCFFQSRAPAQERTPPLSDIAREAEAGGAALCDGASDSGAAWTPRWGLRAVTSPRRPQVSRPPIADQCRPGSGETEAATARELSMQKVV